MGSKVEGIVSAWVVGVILASLILLLSNIGVFGLASRVLPLPVWLKSQFFSPVGSIVGTILLFVSSAPVIFGRVMKSLNVDSKRSSIVISGLVLAGFVIFIASTFIKFYLARKPLLPTFLFLPGGVLLWRPLSKNLSLALAQVILRKLSLNIGPLIIIWVSIGIRPLLPPATGI